MRDKAWWRNAGDELNPMLKGFLLMCFSSRAFSIATIMGCHE
jgi:hypothetical protein